MREGENEQEREGGREGVSEQGGISNVKGALCPVPCALCPVPCALRVVGGINQSINHPIHQSTKKSQSRSLKPNHIFNLNSAPTLIKSD